MEDKAGEEEDWKGWISSAPDKLEHQVIDIVCAIPGRPENWVDERSYLGRLIDSVFIGAGVARDNAIKEKWAKQIAKELIELGRRLHCHVNDSHYIKRRNFNWAYDVIWRHVHDEGDWWLMYGVPLVAQDRGFCDAVW